MTNEFTTQYAILKPDGAYFVHPMNGEIATWSNQEHAQLVLEQFRERAIAMGFSDYPASVVRRYCGPFRPLTADDSDVVAELTEWLKKQTGGRP